MIKRLTGFRPDKRFFIGTAVIVLGALAVEFYADNQGLSYKDIIVVLGALIAAVIIFGGERGIRFGLVLWVLTLALGYRTVELTPNLRLHPSEILIWLLLGCILVQRQLAAKSPVSLPWWLWLLIPFWAFAWWPLVVGDAPWDKMLNEFRDFLLLVPVMIVASFVLRRDGYWRPLLLAFFITSTWIAFSVHPCCQARIDRRGIRASAILFLGRIAGDVHMRFGSARCTDSAHLVAALVASNGNRRRRCLSVTRNLYWWLSQHLARAADSSSDCLRAAAEKARPGDGCVVSTGCRRGIPVHSQD